MARFTLKRDIYYRLPLSLRGLVCKLVPFEVLAGGKYREAFARGALVDAWSRDDIQSYQADRLRQMLTFACEQVPAYRKYQRFLQWEPHEALKAFPLLTKDALMSNLPDYLPRSFDQIPSYPCSTGGTSGTQLHFYLDDGSQEMEMGFMHRQWGRIGYTPRARKATFRGVDFYRSRQGVYWQPNPIYNELQFSPFHMHEVNLAAYVRRLRSYRPHYLHGYPSAISLLASSMQQSGKRIPGIRGILLASEAIYEDQRQVIEEVFGGRAFSWYGHSERLILAGECEHTNAYHHFPDYGYLEMIADGGEVESGETGELVGTGFWNYSLPLIRYQTGDRARRLEPQCVCGRSFDRFDQVRGRWKQEYVIGKHGSRMSLAALNIHGRGFENVQRYQYYQDTIGELTLLLMVSHDYHPEDGEAILKAYQNKVGDELNIALKIVPDIPLTDRGKLKRLVQKIQPIDD